MTALCITMCPWSIIYFNDTKDTLQSWESHSFIVAPFKYLPPLFASFCECRAPHYIISHAFTTTSSSKRSPLSVASPVKSSPPALENGRVFPRGATAKQIFFNQKHMKNVGRQTCESGDDAKRLRQGCVPLARRQADWVEGLRGCFTGWHENQCSGCSEAAPPSRAAGRFICHFCTKVSSFSSDPLRPASGSSCPSSIPPSFFMAFVTQGVSHTYQPSACASRCGADVEQMFQDFLSWTSFHQRKSYFCCFVCTQYTHSPNRDTTRMHRADVHKLNLQLQWPVTSEIRLHMATAKCFQTRAITSV